MMRVQRRRTKGWRMPPDTVYVGRGSIWGNPFTLAEYERVAAVEAYRAMIMRQPLAILEAKAELRGKNLACWCPIDLPCHADVLLDLVNR